LIEILSLADHQSSIQRQQYDQPINEKYDYLKNIFEKVWDWPFE
jgi:hypothetical protein